MARYDQCDDTCTTDCGACKGDERVCPWREKPCDTVTALCLVDCRGAAERAHGDERLPDSRSGADSMTAQRGDSVRVRECRQ